MAEGCGLAVALDVDQIALRGQQIAELYFARASAVADRLAVHRGEPLGVSFGYALHICPFCRVIVIRQLAVVIGYRGDGGIDLFHEVLANPIPVSAAQEICVCLIIDFRIQAPMYLPSVERISLGVYAFDDSGLQKSLVYLSRV